MAKIQLLYEKKFFGFPVPFQTLPCQNDVQNIVRPKQHQFSLAGLFPLQNPAV